MSEAAAGQDNAPPEDGSQKGDGGWKPPSDGSWLPKVRVDEMVQREREIATRAAEEAARWKAEAEAAKAKPEPKQVTRAELNQLVADGKITQDAADAHWEKQIREDAKREARVAAADQVVGLQRDQNVSRQLGEFRQLMPEAWTPGSKERAKVEKEFQALVGLGYPDNKVTEVAALRAAFGDPEVIRASRSTGKTGPGEAHVEVGGGDRPSGEAAADGKPKGLTAREEQFYTDKINRGIYKDWKAVAEERKFAKAKA